MGYLTGFFAWLRGEEDMYGNKTVPLTKDPANWCLNCHRILLTKREKKTNICKDCYKERLQNGEE